MEENIQEAKQTKLYVDASWRVRKERSRTRNPNKKIQGKAINFFGEELLSWRRIVWRKGYSGECCERNRTKKFKGKQTEGKWKQKGKKTTMQINNEEWKKEMDLLNSIRSKDQLMIDSNWEWKRCEFLKHKEKKDLNELKNLNKRINFKYNSEYIYKYMSCIS